MNLCKARLCHTIFILCMLLTAASATAKAANEADFWSAAAKPGVVLIMRHALAPGTGDPDAFKLDDCSTQRNLSEAGRNQARAIGNAIKAAGIAVTRVYTSQWCRCRETAKLLDLGPVEDLTALNSFFRNWTARDARTKALKRFLATLTKTNKAVLVTHQVNITALTDVFPSSGEILAIEITKEGTVAVRARLLIEAQS